MIRFLTGLTDCREAWERFSPGQLPWDDWDLMYAFHDPDSYRLQFLLHETDGQPDGLIPLVENTADQRFELFGGTYAESRVLWVQPGHFPECFDALPDSTVFFDLNGAWVDGLLARHPHYAPHFAERDDQFYVVPREFDFDFMNHINAFPGDKRRSFQRDLRKVRERNPDLAWYWSAADEADLFIELNVRNFGAESDYAGEAGQAEVRRVVAELQQLQYLKTLTVTIDGVKQGTSLSVLYNNRMVVLYASSNNDYDSLGKFLVVETIQEGCRLGVDEVNFMIGQGWKAAWNMNRAQCCTMRKTPRAESP